MEEKKTIFDYIIQIFGMFGFTMLCMMCIEWLFGEGAMEYSSFFSLGGEGVPIATMAEFFVNSVLITGVRYLFFTDLLFKKLSATARTIGMVGVVLFLIIVSVILFDWFPVGMWEAWASFFLCFAVCFAGSLTVSVIRTRTEDKRLAEGLDRMKLNWKGEEENE